MKKMVCNYKSDLKKIEGRIAEIKLKLNKNGENYGSLNRRLAVLLDERDGLRMSIAMMTDYINEVEKRKGEVAWWLNTMRERSYHFLLQTGF